MKTANTQHGWKKARDAEILNDRAKRYTDWGHCPFCMTDQDMLEHMGTCTECDEPLEEGKVDHGTLD